MGAGLSFFFFFFPQGRSILGHQRAARFLLCPFVPVPFFFGAQGFTAPPPCTTKTSFCFFFFLNKKPPPLSPPFWPGPAWERLSSVFSSPDAGLQAKPIFPLPPPFFFGRQSEFRPTLFFGERAFPLPSAVRKEFLASSATTRGKHCGNSFLPRPNQREVALSFFWNKHEPH